MWICNKNVILNDLICAFTTILDKFSLSVYNKVYTKEKGLTLLMCQELETQDEEVVVDKNSNANDDYITLEGLKKQISTLADSNIIQNAAIFIDYDNIYYTMKDYGIDITDDEYNICKMLNDVYGMNVIRKFRAYADFDQVDVKLTPLQEQRVQVTARANNIVKTHRTLSCP